MQPSIHHVLTALALTPLLLAGGIALAACPDKPVRDFAPVSLFAKWAKVVGFAGVRAE